MNYVIQHCSLVFGNLWGLAHVMMGIMWTVVDNVHASQLSFVSGLVLHKEF
jgi:hypothetical protein